MPGLGTCALEYIIDHHGCGCTGSEQQGHLSPRLCEDAGLVLEFGVFRGTSLRQLAAWQCHKRVYGFDNFTGIPEKWREHDVGAFSAGGQLPEVPDNVEIVRGMFDQSLPRWKRGIGRRVVSFLHIDVDLYSSTLTVLWHLADLLAPGSVILFDDLLPSMKEPWQNVLSWDGGLGGELGALHAWARAHPHIEWEWLGWSKDQFDVCLSAALIITRVGPRFALAPFMHKPGLPSLARLWGPGAQCKRPVISSPAGDRAWLQLVHDETGEAWGQGCLRQCPVLPRSMSWHDFLTEQQLCQGAWLDLGYMRNSTLTRWRTVRVLQHRFKRSQAQVLCANLSFAAVPGTAVALHAIGTVAAPGSIIIIHGALRSSSFREPKVEFMGHLAAVADWSRIEAGIAWRWLGRDSDGTLGLIITGLPHQYCSQSACHFSGYDPAAASRRA